MPIKFNDYNIFSREEYEKYVEQQNKKFIENENFDRMLSLFINEFSFTSSNITTTNLISHEFDQDFYINLFMNNHYFFRNIHSFVSTSIDNNENKNETRKSVLKEHNLFFRDKKNDFVHFISSLFFIFLKALKKEAINIDDYIINLNSENMDEFFKLIKKLSLNKTTIELTEKINDVDLKIIDLGIIKSKIKSYLDENYNFNNIDHINNILTIFPKEVILTYLQMVVNINRYDHIFESNMKVLNKRILFNEFSILSKYNRKLLLKTLLFTPFYSKKHIQNAKKTIQKKYGLNKKSFRTFIKNPFLFLGYYDKLTPVFCNNIINKEKTINDFTEKKFKNKDISNLINDLTPFIDKNKMLNYNTSRNYQLFNEVSEITSNENIMLKNFILDNKNKTLFSRNFYNDNVMLMTKSFFNDNASKRNFYAKNSPFLQIAKITPNIFSVREDKNLFFNNFLFSSKIELFYNNNYLTLIFENLMNKYMADTPLNENLLTLLNLFNQIDYYFEMEYSVSNEHIEIYKRLSERRRFFTDKDILDDKNREGAILLIFDYISLIKRICLEDYTLHAFIERVIKTITGICLSYYYPSNYMQSYIIEYYLFHLFKKHYNREINIKNEKDLKLLSKLTEKNHHSFTFLFEKSIEYINVAYINYSNKMCNNVFYKLIDCSNNKYYNKKENVFNVNDFIFRPLIKHIDYISEGKIMHNCLNGIDYIKNENLVVFSVESKTNRKFRINFTLNKDNVVIDNKNKETVEIGSIYSYCNNKNQILIDEFDEALALFKNEIVFNKEEVLDIEII